MTQVKYIKTFSKGQITIPKAFRKLLGMDEDSWLKMYVEEGKLITEPVEKKKEKKKSEYIKKLLSVKDTWDLESEIKKNREETEKQMAKRSL